MKTKLDIMKCFKCNHWFEELMPVNPKLRAARFMCNKCYRQIPRLDFGD